MEICEVCNKRGEECICCPECGHICSLDYGENYCPVCLPEKTYKTIMLIPKCREHNEERKSNPP